MATLPDNLEPNLGHSCEKRSFTHSDISFVEIRDIMIAINFIDLLETTFLNHLWSATWSFFRWLEKKSNKFTLGDLVSVFVKDLSRGQNGSHVTVVSTHVGVIRGSFVAQMWIIFRDW